MDEYFVTQVEIYVDALRAQTNKLRKAIQDGVYDERSIVGDCNLRMESYIERLEEKVAENKTQKLG